MQNLFKWLAGFLQGSYPTIEYKKDCQKELIASLTMALRHVVQDAGMNDTIVVVPCLQGLGSFQIRVRGNRSVREDQPGGEVILVLEVELPKRFTISLFEEGIQAGEPMPCDDPEELEMVAKTELVTKLVSMKIQAVMRGRG